MGDLSREFVPYVMDIVAVHGTRRREPVFFLSRKDFATMGERWTYQK